MVRLKVNMNKLWFVAIILFTALGIFAIFYVSPDKLEGAAPKDSLGNIVLLLEGLAVALGIISFFTIKDASYRRRLILALWLAFTLVMASRALLYLFAQSIFFYDSVFYVLFLLVYSFLSGIAAKEIWPSIFKLSARDDEREMDKSPTETH